jgi:membrane fusion protein, multidrug efflux system
MNAWTPKSSIAAFAVVFGAGTLAAWWTTGGRFIDSTDNAYVQGDIAVLSPRIEGSVASILVADNQAVRAGDPLIQLDATVVVMSEAGGSRPAAA